jgi:hypothetical protein
MLKTLYNYLKTIIFNLKYIMISKKYISFLSFLLILVLASCKKIDTHIYPRESIKLELKTVNGQRLLSWDAIKTSDFKKYQIFASSDSNFDINRDAAKIIGEISDAEKTTFAVKSFILDSLVIGGSSAYYKVAAVLQDRKLPSNVLTTQNDILFASNKFAAVNYFPKLGRIFLQSNLNGSTSYFDFNTKTLTNVGSFLNMTSAVYGTDANNNNELLITNNNGSLTIYNANTMTAIKDITFSSSISAFSYALVKGNVYISGQDFSTGSNVIYVYSQADNALLYTYNLNNMASIMIPTPNQKSLYTGTNFGNINLYTINANGSLSFQASNSNSSINTNFAVNNNGSLFWPGNGVQFFDNTLNIAGTASTAAFLSNVAFSDDNTTIAASANINNGLGVSILDQATFNEVSFIKFENTQQAIFNNIVPMFYNNDLYIMSTVFNASFTNQTLVIVKQ